MLHESKTKLTGYDRLQDNNRQQWMEERKHRPPITTEGGQVTRVSHSTTRRSKTLTPFRKFSTPIISCCGKRIADRLND